jgi:hypothetical protein
MAEAVILNEYDFGKVAAHVGAPAGWMIRVLGPPGVGDRYVCWSVFGGVKRDHAVVLPLSPESVQLYERYERLFIVQGPLELPR